MNGFIDDCSSTSIDNLKIPDNDRRILELLALKKEQERYSEHLAHRSQLLWEKSQNERIKARYNPFLIFKPYLVSFMLAYNTIITEFCLNVYL